jgi:hypothetical protein
MGYSRRVLSHIQPRHLHVTDVRHPSWECSVFVNCILPFYDHSAQFSARPCPAAHSSSLRRDARINALCIILHPYRTHRLTSRHLRLRSSECCNHNCRLYHPCIIVILLHYIAPCFLGVLYRPVRRCVMGAKSKRECTVRNSYVSPHSICDAGEAHLTELHVRHARLVVHKFGA